jgi:hypothetical protein
MQSVSLNYSKTFWAVFSPHAYEHVGRTNAPLLCHCMAVFCLWESRRWCVILLFRGTWQESAAFCCLHARWDDPICPAPPIGAYRRTLEAQEGVSPK